MTFEPKMPILKVFIQNQRILDRCAFAHCKIGIRRSTATSYKEKSFPKYFWPLNFLFFIKSTKNICFYPNHRMLNSYAFASSRIKIKSLDSTINKRKNLCIPYTARKKSYFYQKITKIQLFDLKCAIINRYAYESRNIEVINSEVTKN